MSLSVEALITPSVLEWARKRSRLREDEAALRILGKDSPLTELVAKLLQWESGLSRPTIAQMRKVCEVYKRPLAMFYMEEPPEEFETLRDFRSGSASGRTDFSPSLALLLRRSFSKSAWLHDYLRASGNETLAFVGAANVSDGALNVAERIRRQLGVTPLDQINSSSREEALRLWIRHAEQQGIFVFRDLLDPEEVSGFVVSDTLAPFIFLNGNDAVAKQLFTLGHELCHLWLDQSSISDLRPFTPHLDTEIIEIETFCNLVSSQLLLSEPEFGVRWHLLPSNQPLELKISDMSRTFKVSEEAIAIRLLRWGVLDEKKYWSLREQYRVRWIKWQAENREKLRNTDGGPSPYVTSVSHNGRSFTQTIVSGYLEGSISGRDASALLNFKVNNLKKLGRTAGLPIAYGVGDE